MQKKKLLYFFYNRLNDPLLQSNIFLYINELSKENNYSVAIITYEDEKYPLSKDEIKALKEKLATVDITWHPLKWHSGSHIYFKLIDLISGFFKVFYLAKIKGYKNVISLGSIAGSYVYLFSKIIKLNLYLYQYEPHSEYAIDNKIWEANSLQYKLLNKFEKKAAQKCTTISSGTGFMQTRLQDWNIKGKFFKIRSVANTDLFYFSEKKRKEFRIAHGITDSKKLIIYPGKTGDLYFEAAVLVAICKLFARADSSFHFLIISPNINEIKDLLEKENPNLLSSFTLLPPVNYQDMPAALCAADIGIVGVSPGNSKKFISNIKVGEYLCAGLPYLICKGISEDDIIAEGNNVGVVIKKFSEEEIKNSYSKIKELLNEPKEAIAERCRRVGIEYRGFEKQFKEYKKALNSLTEK